MAGESDTSLQEGATEEVEKAQSPKEGQGAPLAIGMSEDTGSIPTVADEINSKIFREEDLANAEYDLQKNLEKAHQELEAMSKKLFDVFRRVADERTQAKKGAISIPRNRGIKIEYTCKTGISHYYASPDGRRDPIDGTTHVVTLKDREGKEICTLAGHNDFLPARWIQFIPVGDKARYDGSMQCSPDGLMYDYFKRELGKIEKMRADILEQQKIVEEKAHGQLDDILEKIDGLIRDFEAESQEYMAAMDPEKIRGELGVYLNGVLRQYGALLQEYYRLKEDETNGPHKIFPQELMPVDETLGAAITTYEQVLEGIAKQMNDRLVGYWTLNMSDYNIESYIDDILKHLREDENDSYKLDIWSFRDHLEMRNQQEIEGKIAGLKERNQKIRDFIQTERQKEEAPSQSATSANGKHDNRPQSDGTSGSGGGFGTLGDLLKKKLNKG